MRFKIFIYLILCLQMIGNYANATTLLDIDLNFSGYHDQIYYLQNVEVPFWEKSLKVSVTDNSAYDYSQSNGSQLQANVPNAVISAEDPNYGHSYGWYDQGVNAEIQMSADKNNNPFSLATLRYRHDSYITITEVYEDCGYIPIDWYFWGPVIDFSTTESYAKGILNIYGEYFIHDVSNGVTDTVEFWAEHYFTQDNVYFSGSENYNYFEYIKTGDGSYRAYSGFLSWAIWEPFDVGDTVHFGVRISASAKVFESTPIPEPATILLLGTGLVGLAALGRKKFKR